MMKRKIGFKDLGSKSGKENGEKRKEEGKNKQ